MYREVYFEEVYVGVCGVVLVPEGMHLVIMRVDVVLNKLLKKVIAKVQILLIKMIVGCKITQPLQNKQHINMPTINTLKPLTIPIIFPFKITLPPLTPPNLR